MSDPLKLWDLTDHDRRFLRMLRIWPGSLCTTCHGDGCLDCNKTGRVKYRPPVREDDGA